VISRHFGLGWAFVDPKTPIERGTKFCVCVKELIPWIMMPLQIAYVTDTSADHRSAAVMAPAKASFGFGSGTLHGHLLVTSPYLFKSICISVLEIE